MQLIHADARLQESYLGALDELAAEGNGHFLTLELPAGDGFPGTHFDRTALADPATFEEFCAYSRAFELPETPRPAGWVASSMLWMVEDDEVVGRISFRHDLTPSLVEVGGHIGYAVRPSARGQGHAADAVRQLLPRCAAHGLERVLLTCDATNHASRRTIERCGGVLEDQRGEKLRFWVSTTGGATRAEAVQGLGSGA